MAANVEVGTLRKLKGASSRFLGVFWETTHRRWRATVYEPGPPRHTVLISHFEREEEAAIAYDRVVLLMRGASAPRNFPRRRLSPATVREIREELRQRKKRHTTSRWLGVHFLADTPRYRYLHRPWRALVRTPSGRVVDAGRWASERKAALAYDRAALWYCGENATLNFRDRALRLGPADVEQLRTECERDRKTTTTSRFRGVSWNTDCACWRAVIRSEGKLRHLGLFAEEEDAARAYDTEARRLHGPRAKLNFSRVRQRPARQ